MKVKVSYLDGRTGFVQNCWYADHDIIGDIQISDNIDSALDVDENELEMIEIFYKEFDAKVELLK